MSELRDQGLHAAATVVALLPATLWPGMLSFAWAGFCLGMNREIREEGAKVSPASIWKALHSFRDLSTWTVFGALMGAVA